MFISFAASADICCQKNGKTQEMGDDSFYIMKYYSAIRNTKALGVLLTDMNNFEKLETIFEKLKIIFEKLESRFEKLEKQNVAQH